MKARGVYELRDLGNLEQRSADGETFSTSMHEIHEHVKQKLQERSLKYKKRSYLKRREQIFEVGELVLVHMRKERFPKGEYNKQKIQKNWTL